MPWVEKLSDPQELRRCIRDLVALSTLPALWTNYGPQQIADSVSAALLSMLNADFVYIKVPASRDEPLIEIAHTRKKSATGAANAIRGAIRGTRIGPSEQAAAIPNPFGEGTLQVATAPIGFGDDSILVIGSA